MPVTKARRRLGCRGCRQSVRRVDPTSTLRVNVIGLIKPSTETERPEACKSRNPARITQLFTKFLGSLRVTGVASCLPNAP